MGVYDMENFQEIVKQKKENDKVMLKLEWVIVFLAAIPLFTGVFCSTYPEIEEWQKVALMSFGILVLIIGIAAAIKIEQVAGYYECRKCHHKYVPKYSNILWSIHTNRTRYMKCPKCNEMSWQKKVLE